MEPLHDYDTPEYKIETVKKELKELSTQIDIIEVINQDILLALKFPPGFKYTISPYGPYVELKLHPDNQEDKEALDHMIAFVRHQFGPLEVKFCKVDGDFSYSTSWIKIDPDDEDICSPQYKVIVAKAKAVRPECKITQVQETVTRYVADCGE